MYGKVRGRFKSSAELVEFIRVSLGKEDSNPISAYTLGRLDRPDLLVAEYRKTPGLTLENPQGDWFFIWRNQPVRVGDKDEWLLLHELIEELERLLESEERKAFGK